MTGHGDPFLGRGEAKWTRRKCGKKKGLPDYVQSRLWMHQTLRRAKPRARVRGGAKASGHGGTWSLSIAHSSLHTTR